MNKILTFGAISAIIWQAVTAHAESGNLDADFVVRICAGIVNQTITSTNGTYKDPDGSIVTYSNGGTLKIAKPGDIPRIINSVGSGDYNSCISNIVQNWNKQQEKLCRIRQNGVEKYTRTFITTGSSPEMSGGHSQGEWCNTMIGNLRGQIPDGDFTAVGSSESSRSGCSPFNCPLYTYQCTVSVQAEPVFKEAPSPYCP